MAIFHLHVRNISRGEGRSAIAAAAYRAGETLPNDAEEKESSFGGRRDVLHTEVCLPSSAPAWMADRARLWNAVEASERRKDARLAKEIEFALPRELAPAIWLSVARSMAALYTAAGHVVDLAVHEDGSGHNPHVHLLLSTRKVGPEGFGGKLREADGLRFVTDARASWARIANEALAAAGVGVEVEPRSHANAGIGSVPGQHRGPNKHERRARRMQRSQADEANMQELQEQLRKADEQDEQRLPVPAPDGRPLSPAEQNAAEQAMIAQMERPTDEWWTISTGHRAAALTREPQTLPGDDWWDAASPQDDDARTPAEPERGEADRRR